MQTVLMYGVLWLVLLQEQLKIVITVNYIIPLIVNFVDEKNKIYKIQCLLGDRVYDKITPYFSSNYLDSNDYYLVSGNKTINNDYFKIFYEIISEEQIHNRLDNKNIMYTSSDNLEKTNTTIINDKKK